MDKSQVVEGIALVPHDQSGAKHLLGDLELVRSLPYRLQGLLLWAVFVDEKTGLTVDQPPYDPWGEAWKA